MNIEERIQRFIRKCEKMKGPVLSVYLTMDRSDSLDAEPDSKALQRGFSQLRQLIDVSELNLFDDGVSTVSEYVKKLHSDFKGLVCVYDTVSGTIIAEKFMVPFKFGLHWARTSNLRPFLECLNKHKRYGVLLTGKKGSRWFRIFFGEIIEDAQFFSDLPAGRDSYIGREQDRSFVHPENPSEPYTLQHLSQIARRISLSEKKQEFSDLILSGPDEAAYELYHLLPESVQRRVAQFHTIGVDAPAGQILREILKMTREFERSKRNTVTTRIGMFESTKMNVSNLRSVCAV